MVMKIKTLYKYYQACTYIFIASISNLKCYMSVRYYDTVTFLD